MRDKFEGFLVWLIRPSCSAEGRDVVTAFMIGQGLIRVIDGRLFSLPALSYLPDGAYGHLQFLVGCALLATRWRRTTPLGGYVAAIAAGVCLMLAAASFNTAATSSFGAIVLCILAVNEAIAGLHRRPNAVTT